MRRPIMTMAVLIVAASVGLSGVLAGSNEPAGYPAPDYLNGVDRLGTADSIEFFERRLDDHHDTSTLSTLGRLYLTRSRETGDQSLLDDAERTFNEALALRADHPGALLGLSAVRHAQHRFPESLTLAEAAYDAEPSGPTLSVIGDVKSALGDYEGAGVAYDQALADFGAEAVLPGLALLSEVKGQPAEAVRLLEQAAAGSLEARVVGEPAAWYQERLAHLHLEQGNVDEAERRFEAALSLFPESTDSIAGLASVAEARREYDKALGILTSLANPGPGELISIGDLYVATDRPDIAETYFSHAIEQMRASDIRMTARELAMFYADHDRNPDEALRLAMEDFERRPDLHGYETLAWTLYRAGQFEEARSVSDEALAFGVNDSPLRYHAGLIALALGEHERAKAELEMALDINPEWHVLHADHAREVLSSLPG
ncbi:MAG: tetratricopeptide repeat protein [Acidimicrobiia bacterium]|nr:tetratricopeptide repeat protein [Acidimicrobiia bacterium]